jgi:hypothetical protein
MLPAFGLQLAAHIFAYEDDFFVPCDVPDLGDGDSGDAGRDMLSGRSSEQEFVIFAAVQGGREIHFLRRAADSCERDGCGVDLRTYAALVANVAQVGGEAIA